MFGSQSMRLLRESWKGMFGAKRLAQELFAMFQDDIPLEHSGPITLIQSGDGPALDLRRKPGADGPLLKLTPRQLPNIDLQTGGEDGGVDVYEDGGIVIRGPYVEIESVEDGVPVRRKLGGDNSPSPEIQVTATGGGGGFPGQVTAGGPGDSYTVDVYEGGLASAATSRTVRQLSIGAAETIPAGTWVTVNTVTEADDSTTYFMQVPVWL